ncbi:hypothetical protein NCCNTM_54470 [Mycolicibacterium sp. NCC-Tsukiji]|nr:hypothetical protein NCCNTM_54470 [Mycolicibacterium sp. NCC-Tsukiji]
MSVPLGAFQAAEQNDTDPRQLAPPDAGLGELDDLGVRIAVATPTADLTARAVCRPCGIAKAQVAGAVRNNRSANSASATRAR